MVMQLGASPAVTLAATANKTSPTGLRTIIKSNFNVSTIKTPSLTALNAIIKNEGCSSNKAAVTSNKIAFTNLAVVGLDPTPPGSF